MRQMLYLAFTQPQMAGEKVAHEQKGAQKVSCPYLFTDEKGRGLQCAQFFQGTVIRWTHHIKDKSRAYLEVLLRQQVRIAHREECTDNRPVAH